MPMLHETFSTLKTALGANVFSDLVPDYIKDNLNPNFEMRPYQKEAFGRFEFYLDKYQNKPKNEPINVLYHMATGSGKTLVMAGEILTLYKRGYRNFLFFVNSTNIIKKTKENFLNKGSSKYLFNSTINIDGEQINIKEVENFATTNSNDINIVFTTIQGLHAVILNPKENALSMEDFEDNKVVLISDEAHHINAETKKKKSKEEQHSVDSWENTIREIFTANSSNIMLEFTATADIADQKIKEKYQDIVLFDYPLKNFREDLYSKEVKVLQSDSEPFSRSLRAIILSQYRRKVFEKHHLVIKPVILFKAKTIADSQVFHKEFQEKIEAIEQDDLEAIKNTSIEGDVIHKAFQFFEKNNIKLDSLALELKEDFSVEKTIEVNSQKAETYQIELNSLEDPDNEIRAIFAVDMLNEGWDVLNLFDIVRLYDTRNKWGKTATQEAQLIGRGARYCPFKVEEDQPLYQRKYDILDDTVDAHELKICEELYYHSAHNPEYISDLNIALQEIGIKPKTRRELSLRVKGKFKETSLYKSGLIYVNKRVSYDRSKVKGLDSSIINTNYSYAIKTEHSNELTIFENATVKHLKVKRERVNLIDMGKHIIRKAMATIPAYRFNELKSLFPHLKTIDEFIISSDYLGSILVEISGREDVLENIPQIEKLKLCKKVLSKIAEQLNVNRIDYEGTKEFTPKTINELYDKDKILNISNDGLTEQEFGIAQSETTNDELSLDLSKCDWFVFNENYGTSEEKYFVRYLDTMIDDLKAVYDDVYLLRNEKHFKLYAFDDGRPFEPDFLLLLTKQDQELELTYQVFIEPKGAHLFENDAWKQNFLLDLKATHQIEQVWKGKEFVVWGLPFYNHLSSKTDFEPEFEELLK
ncbi:type III restriction endonuclease subunit R [Vibrio cholerae]|uniref:DEAD/DEAH box helicase family protein n=1 Tax=Vibrio cholerae TaxID=666 RepID=UPI0011D99491|nr:DEAD/DEAH box helicase family protein [Vibrio cholerae]EGR2498002.1 DEAD/DEAH box helicase [Vibrio cholerae]TXZ57246.1 DEAD/DEAH box helicase [Vibrio cholerae]GHW19967.1 type III restriction endonuclease subunit R [Vibrio cholerae]